MSWALLFHKSDLAALGPLRHEPGVEACVRGEEFWLRGHSINDQLAARLRFLPALQRYQIGEAGSLVAEGTLVPSSYLPEGTWLPLANWLPVSIPSAQSSTTPVGFEPCAITLVREGTVRTPNLLLTSLENWARYACTAPLLRLQRWTFAANNRGRALILGMPLPSLAGELFVEQEGIALPAGWTWSPAIDVPLLRELLQASEGDLLLLGREPTGSVSYQLIPDTAFVRATRSAVRRTVEGVAS